MAAYTSDDGTWRSLVARLLWEQEAPGSNPGVPISLARPAAPYGRGARPPGAA